MSETSLDPMLSESLLDLFVTRFGSRNILNIHVIFTSDIARFSKCIRRSARNIISSHSVDSLVIAIHLVDRIHIVTFIRTSKCIVLKPTIIKSTYLLIILSQFVTIFAS